MSLALNTMNNDTLTESLDRLAQLAIEGVREARGTRPSRYTQRCQMIEEHGRFTSEDE